MPPTAVSKGPATNAAQVVKQLRDIQHRRLKALEARFQAALASLEEEHAREGAAIAAAHARTRKDASDVMAMMQAEFTEIEAEARQVFPRLRVCDARAAEPVIARCGCTPRHCGHRTFPKKASPRVRFAQGGQHQYTCGASHHRQAGLRAGIRGAARGGPEPAQRGLQRHAGAPAASRAACLPFPNVRTPTARKAFVAPARALAAARGRRTCGA